MEFDVKILVAIEPADFRKGIDGLARLCQDTLGEDLHGDGVLLSQSARHGDQGARLRRPRFLALPQTTFDRAVRVVAEIA